MSQEVQDGPTAVTLAVGKNIRHLRKSVGISQEVLANALDLSFQQVQKYENGSNRVSADMLFRIAKRLNCTVTDLFAGTEGLLEEPIAPEAPVPGRQPPSWIDQARELDIRRPGLISRLHSLPEQALDALDRTANCVLHSAERALATVGAN